MEKIIVGLGNPGKKYQKTRHNIGFRIIENFLKEKKDQIIKIQKKFDAEIVIVNNELQNFLAVKPLTFMNNSGIAVKKIVRHWKCAPQNIIVVHDEIDLPFGEIRVSKNASSAGHKGVQSIIDELKTQDFTRIRIGIYPKLKAKSQKPKVNAIDFVLENFSNQEEGELKDITKRAIEEINALLSSHS